MQDNKVGEKNMMERIQKIERLKEIESSIGFMENALIGVNSGYFQEGTLTLSISSKEFNYNQLFSENTEIKFTKDIMIDYLNKQIDEFKREYEVILDSLTSKR